MHSKVLDPQQNHVRLDLGQTMPSDRHGMCYNVSACVIGPYMGNLIITNCDPQKASKGWNIRISCVNNDIATSSGHWLPPRTHYWLVEREGCVNILYTR